MRTTFLLGSLVAVLACGGSSYGGSGSAGGPGGYTPDAGTLADGGPGTDGGNSDAGPGSVVSISLSQTDVHIQAGQKTAFAVTGTRPDGARVDVTSLSQAVSSNPSVVTLQNGPGAQIQIFANAPGQATVTVTYQNLQQTCAVTVNR